MIPAILLMLHSCISKIVVVDDIGLANKKARDPEIVKRAIDALQSTAKNNEGTVIVANINGTRKSIDGIDERFNIKRHNNFSDSSNDTNEGINVNWESEARFSPVTTKMLSGGSGNANVNHANVYSVQKHMNNSFNNASQFENDFSSGMDFSRLGSRSKAYEYSNAFSTDSKHSTGEPYLPLSFRSSKINMLDDYLDDRLDEGPETSMVRRMLDEEPRSRKSVISLKMAQSKQKENMLQSSIDKISQEIDQVSEKIQDVQKSKDIMTAKLHTKRNHLRNLQINKKEVDIQRGRTLALIRISRNELLKLSKMIDDQKSKLALLEDEEKIFTDRIRKYDEEHDVGVRELQLEESRSEEIKRSIEELEKIYNMLKVKSNELLNQRNRESSIRNKLELEVERLDRNSIDFI
ncbi:hypothetical protein CWI42_110340 [Ordospora colligata]|uniref:Uncharacterized protein n=1 Tax=Ordospora colligata OC4 TaxID=1354746 RepID=A0A0B2UID4_9MICR|nr:uncharacterized protein M896_110340 [Ordospora colligata OC4]KHN69004.1 hypothetical protein M896_110340 [Ordospora colligata OC4]TBU14232.1 hypothetical protein CWI40_110340 [Ordospora colligata]TBU14279.1 hypothetical protein CWI41_110340 [Ordospora colligata]TBU17909.1 hypothetical protein CWI42_110340 [Ordospora colligata]